MKTKEKYHLNRFKDALLTPHTIGYLTAFLLFFLMSSVIAQDNNMYWLQKSNEFPTDVVEDIEQDDNGNILLCNHLGLFIYNGLHFRHITKKDGLANSSSENFYKDAYGRIWITSYAGKITIYENGKFTALHAYNNSKYLDLNLVRVISISRDHVLIEKLRSNQLLDFHFKNGKWVLTSVKTYGKDNSFPVILPFQNDKVNGVFNLDKFDETGEFSLELFGKIKKYRSELKERYVSRHFGEKYVLWSVGQWVFHINFKGQVRSRKFQETIKHIYPGKGNALWISYKSGGIQKINKTDLKPIGERILKKESIYDFLQDNEGNIWFTTLKNIGMIPNNPYTKWTVNHTLSSFVNNCFYLNDTLFIGHTNGDIGFILPATEGDERLFYRQPDLGIPNMSVRDFILFNGFLYYCNSNGGLFRINRKSLTVEHVIADVGVSNVSLIKNKLYLATKRGLLIYDGRKIERLFTDKYLESVIAQDDGQIFLGCLDGLFTLRNGRLVKVNWLGLTDERIASFAATKDFLAIGTYGNGIVLKTKHRTISIQKENGLPSDFINSLFVDKLGRLIVSTGNGVAMIKLDKRDPTNYQIESISGNECLDYDTYYGSESPNGIFFASTHGIFHVNKIKHSSGINPLVLNQVYLDGKSISGKQLRFIYSSDNLLEVRYRQNNFTASLSTHYFYRLHPNEKWIKTTNESILLKGLAPGNYNLELFAINNVSKKRSNIITLPITIEPRFWQMRWLQILAFTILIAVIIWVVRTRYRRRELNKKKDFEFKLQIARLESNALRSQMNPHFVFNALNSIQSFILRNDKDSAYKFLGKFSSLIRQVLEHSRSEKISIADEIVMLSNYLDLERMRSNDSFDYDIVVDSRINRLSTSIPIMLLQPLVENAVIHGVLPLTRHKGKIDIIFYQLPHNDLEIVIRDNGIGRKASAALKKKKQKYHESVGVSISKERTDRLNFDYINSTFEIKDLFNNDGEPEGTEIKIRIKLSNDKSSNY